MHAVQWKSVLIGRCALIHRMFFQGRSGAFIAAILALVLVQTPCPLFAQKPLAKRTAPRDMIALQKDSVLTRAMARYSERIRQLPAKPGVALTEREQHAFFTELDLLHGELVAAFVGDSVEGLDRWPKGVTTRICVIGERTLKGVPCAISTNLVPRAGVVSDDYVPSNYVLFLQLNKTNRIRDDSTGPAGCFDHSVADSRGRPRWEIYCSVESDSTLFFAGDTVVVTGTMSHPQRQYNYGLVWDIRYLWFHSPKQASIYGVAQRDRLTRRLQEISDSVKRAAELEQRILERSWEKRFSADLPRGSWANPLSIPRPFWVRPYTLDVTFVVNSDGGVTEVFFDPPSKDAAYNRRVLEQLMLMRFRPARRYNGSTVPDTVSFTWSIP